MDAEKELMKNEYEITVIIATYNPQLDKLLATIDSVITQKGVEVQLIIADDGSKDNLFSKIDDYLKSNNFFAYKLLALEVNKGTVANIMNAIHDSEGYYVKGISPGDMLYGENALRGWIDGIRASGKRWSFCDVSYYYMDNGVRVSVKGQRHPRILWPYIKDNEVQCRKNYLIHGDNANGAGILCETKLMADYLDKIFGKIKYAEDNIFRLMMWDGFTPYYYPKEAVLYEYGEGISTSNNKRWEDILKKEWDTITSMFVNEVVSDKLQMRIQKRCKKSSQLVSRISNFTWYRFNLIIDFWFSIRH